MSLLKSASKVPGKIEGELALLKARHKDLLKEKASLLKELATNEKRFEVLEVAKVDVGKVKYSKLITKPHGRATAIICATDWHVEQTVSKAAVNGLNRFNLSIARKRVEKLWQKAVFWLNHARGISNIEDAILWLGGDFISGYIHDELVEGNSLSPTEAILESKRLITSGIEHILKHSNLKSLTIVTNYGNHGRTTQKYRVATAHRNSYEWAMYKGIEAEYSSNPRVQVRVSNGYHNLVDMYGFRLRFHHGDYIKYNGGVGGLAIPVNKAISAWDKGEHADFDVFGHWHQFLRTPKFLSVGCLVGYDEFALSIKADYQPPTQAFIVIDKDRGVVTAEQLFVE